MHCQKIQKLLSIIKKIKNKSEKIEKLVKNFDEFFYQKKKYYTLKLLLKPKIYANTIPIIQYIENIFAQYID